MNLGSGNSYKARGAERLHMAYRALFVLAGALIAAAPLGMPATAHVPAKPAAFDFNPALRAWMSQHQIPAASVAIMKDDRLVSTAGFGGMNAGTPARIASLSKAITGVCIAHLIESGRLSFTTPLGSVLRPAFARLGQPADPRFRSITIEQLLTHRSGLPREALRRAPARDLTGSFLNVLATPLDSDPGGAMVYSNIGYLTLGMVVETVTGSDYERFCRDAALRPMQAVGTIDPQLRQRASSGGWRVSAVDYARFVQIFNPAAAVLGPTARQWQDALSGPSVYGLGMYIRRSERGILLTHTGRVALREHPGGSYVIRFPNGWTAVVAFEGDARGGGRELRGIFATALAGL
jgi:CubicO group peptidase (beta-lactamase class C family)